MPSHFFRVLMLSAFFVSAETQAEDQATRPRIAMCVPLAVEAGTTSKVILRGWQIDKATEVRSPVEGVAIKILSKGNAPVPNPQDAKRIGDQQVEVEITIPKDVKPEIAQDQPQQRTIPVSIKTPGGESEPHALYLGAKFPVAIEKEPNDGFRQAQAAGVPQIVDGQIHGDRNVDVFAVELSDAGEVGVEVLARRLGSGLDSTLTIYDAHGNILEANDDHAGTADSRVTFLAKAGRYFIAVQDAHDHGGPAHPYRLVIRLLE